MVPKANLEINKAVESGVNFNFPLLIRSYYTIQGSKLYLLYSKRGIKPLQPRIIILNFGMVNKIYVHSPFPQPEVYL